MTQFRTTRLVLAPLVLALALSACDSKQPELTVIDESGAPSIDFTVDNPTEPAVPVDLPSTAMTNVPPKR